MHDTAFLAGFAFFRVYGDRLGKPRVLEVGSKKETLSSMRQHMSPDYDYVGIDISPGPEVDITIDPKSNTYPFPPESFDLIVSVSSFEHDEMFWMTFCKMCRVLKPGGYIFINAPRNGPRHGYPGDCWRFYEDAAPALAKWANYYGKYDIKVVENYSQMPMKDVWIDQVMVFGKAPIQDVGDNISNWLCSHYSVCVIRE